MGLPQHAESEYAYSNRSARPEAARVRVLVNAWFSEYPEASTADLKARFQSKDSGTHLGALNELLIHALFVRLGYEIAVVPAGPANEKRPDFELTSDIRQDFDIEATVSAGSRHEQARRRRATAIYDALARIGPTDFYIYLGETGGPETQLSSRALYRDVKKWLDSLDVEEVYNAYIVNPDCEAPRSVWQYDSWKIDLLAIPKEPRYRGEDVVPPHLRYRDPGLQAIAESMRNALERKTTRYGQRERPYIIVLGDNRPIRQKYIYDLQRILFGYSSRRVDRVGSEVLGFPVSRTEAIFCGPARPQNTRLSGVAFVRGLGVWEVANLRLVYIENPWARHRLLNPPAAFERWTLNQDGNGLIRRGPEMALRELFGLPEGWPE